MKIKIITFVIELGIKSIVAPCDEGGVSISSKPDPPSRATPGDSHILAAPGVRFSLLCLAGGGLSQNKNLRNMPGGGVLARFYRPGGSGF